MSSRNSADKLSESFRREMDLLHHMASDNDDGEEISEQLGNLCLKEEDKNIVFQGPLSEAFYVVNCPFVWTEYISNENMESFITEIKAKVEFHDEDWKTFCFSLYFAFIYARLGKFSDAFKKLEFCDNFLSENGDNEFYKPMLDGLNHGIHATRAHVNFLNGNADVADELISSVIPVKDLNKSSRAALIALNAELLQEFGPKSKEMALEMVKVAIKLDPDDDGSRRGLFYYMAGKFYGQLRRMDHRFGMPSREELQMLERARKTNPFPVSLAALADAYREASSSAAFDSKVKVSKDVCFKMLSEAKKLYIRAFELDDNSCSTLRRCGNGLMKLPPPHKDLALAKQCLLKAVSINPKCSAAYQALGTMEEKYFKNLHEALNYFQLAYDNGNPVSPFFILQVRIKLQRNYNPVNDIDKFIENLKEGRPDLRSEFLILKGEYLFFLRNDLLAAAELWKEAIEINPTSENVMNHVCRFLQGKHKEKPYLQFTAGRQVFNLFDCLKYEIRDALRNQKYDKNNVLLVELLKLCENNTAR